MQDDLMCFGGDFVPAKDARIHMLSLGAPFGINVFEGLRAYWNEERKELDIFRLDDHCRRLLQSAMLMNIDHGCTLQIPRESVMETLRRNHVREDVHIRQTLFVAAEAPLYARGQRCLQCRSSHGGGRRVLTLVSSAWLAPGPLISDNVMPPRIKCSANYHSSRMAALEARAGGYEESTAASLFIIRDGVPVTPSVSQARLEGITRRSTIQALEEDLGREVQQREVDRTELYVANEVFLCGTATEVLAIAQVDRQIIDGCPGEVTRAIHERYLNIVRGTSASRPEWRTPV